MAIDMSTVKAITHNNKDVTMIQDSHGNVLWQKVFPKLYYSRSGYQYEFENGNLTTKTWSGLSSYNGNSIYGVGEKIWYSTTSAAYELSGNTWISRTTSVVGYFTDGNKVVSDGTNTFYFNGTTIYRWNTTTNKWVSDSSNWTGRNSGYTGNIMFKANGKIYCLVSSNSNLVEVDTTNKRFTVLSTSAPQVQGWYAWSDGVNTYLSKSGTSYQFNPSDNSFTSVTFTGDSDFTQASFSGDLVFKYNGNYYYSQNQKIFILDIANKCWSLAYTLSENLPSFGAFLWDEGGRVLTEACPCARI